PSEISTLSLHDALPISTGLLTTKSGARLPSASPGLAARRKRAPQGCGAPCGTECRVYGCYDPPSRPGSTAALSVAGGHRLVAPADRKSTRLNSSHVKIS